MKKVLKYSNPLGQREGGHAGLWLKWITFIHSRLLTLRPACAFCGGAARPLRPPSQFDRRYSSGLSSTDDEVINYGSCLFYTCPPPQPGWGHSNSDSSCKRRHSNNPRWWPIDCSVATRPISIEKWPFGVVGLVAPPCFSDSLSEMGNVMTSPRSADAGNDGSGRSRQLVPLTPPGGGRGVAASSCRKSSFSQRFPTGSRWFLVPAVIWADCCHQPGCRPHSLQRSEHFHASQPSLSHPSPR